jgi:hypothetical protein
MVEIHIIVFHPTSNSMKKEIIQIIQTCFFLIKNQVIVSISNRPNYTKKEQIFF